MPRSPFRNVLIIKRCEILDTTSILALIEEAQANHGISIRAICRAAGVSTTSYYQWRAGRGIMPETQAAVRSAIRQLTKRAQSQLEAEK
ncbi:transposase [Chelatococcus daeguensis]|uniref:transposase n=1 Tax=Chelatococcus daeguensis TaxID=444444 RepID=UPI003D7C1DBF